MKQGIININGLRFEPLIYPSNIERKVAWIANEINKKEEETEPIFIVVMTGAFIFAADLLRQVIVDCDIRFLRAKSYAGSESTGKINIEYNFLSEIHDRNIILIEDIVDTGFTITEISKALREHGAASIKVCSFLSKPEALKYPVTIDYLGFEVPNDFVIGYGLDFNDKGRNLSVLYKLINET